MYVHLTALLLTVGERSVGYSVSVLFRSTAVCKSEDAFAKATMWAGQRSAIALQIEYNYTRLL